MCATNTLSKGNVKYLINHTFLMKETGFSTGQGAVLRTRLCSCSCAQFRSNLTESNVYTRALDV